MIAMIKAMSVKSNSVLSFKITNNGVLSPQDICEVMKMMPPECDVTDIEIIAASKFGSSVTMKVTYETEEAEPVLIGKREE